MTNQIELSRMTGLAMQLVQANQILTEATDQLDFETARVLISEAINLIEQVVSRLGMMATNQPTRAGHRN